MQTHPIRKARARKPRRAQKVPPTAVPISALLKSAWPLYEYLKLVGFGKSLYYELDESLRPESILIGRKRMVIEPPSAYVRRLADALKAGA